MAENNNGYAGLLRRLPHNIEAEMAVLGSVFVFGSRTFDKIGALAPDHFILESHRAIWTRCMALFAAGSIPDPITLRTWAEEEPLLEGKGADYLRQLADTAVPPIVVESYAATIIDDSRKRQIIELTEILSSHAYNGEKADDVVREALDAFAAFEPVARGHTEFHEMRTLGNLDIAPMDQLVDGLVPSVGLTMLVAKPKVGKSWMLLDIALACAGGGFALGELRCQKTPGLFLMLEDSPRRLKDRINRICAPAGVPAGATAVFEWARGSDGIRSIEGYLDKHPETGIVGIDVLAAFRAHREAQNGGYSEDYEDVKQLQALAQRRQIAIILVHHLRKADSDDPIDLVSGTLGIVGAADHIIVITGNKESGYKLTSRGRDIPDKAWDIEYADGRWTILGDTAPRVATNTVDRIERDQHIRDLHASGKSLREIAVIVGLGKTAIEKILKKRKNDELCV